MKYTKEQRLDIGRKLYVGEITRRQVAEIYGISEQSARDYMRLYRDSEKLPPKQVAKHSVSAPSFRTQSAGLEELESMTKEQLIKCKFSVNSHRWVNHSVQVLCYPPSS